ncbi:hypothetical protein PT276_08800 [Orbaceae bacterium ESL0721]|nr:hypothetical protein [Orbaceae bacterium ESL0721]
MKVIYLWQQLRNQLIVKSAIKTALSHLLLGVIAAGFSLSGQASVLVQITPHSEQTKTVTISSLVQKKQTPQIKISEKHATTSTACSSSYRYIASNSRILLPNHGIRAGPHALGLKNL